MSGKYTNVPYGYEPPPATRKGTLIFYDSFEHVTDEQLERAAAIADTRSFVQLVLYPLHENTVKRMSKDGVQPFTKGKTVFITGEGSMHPPAYGSKAGKASERSIRRSKQPCVIWQRNIRLPISCISRWRWQISLHHLIRSKIGLKKYD